MRNDFNLEYWQNTLRLALIQKLTGTQEENKLSREHYDMLIGATGISKKTLLRFLRHQKSIGSQTRNWLAAFWLERTDEIDSNGHDTNDLFIEFIEAYRSGKTETVAMDADSNILYTDWRNQPKTELMIYEAAFLWHGQEPPAIAAHFYAMTRKIEETKAMLHAAIEEGQMKVTREIQFPNGVTRYVNITALRDYAKSIDQYPAFLFSGEA